MKTRRQPPKWTAWLAASTSALMLILVLTAMWLVEASGEAALYAEERETISDELDLLVRIDLEEGAEGLVRAVSRLAAVEQSDQLYLLRDASGKLLAGNVEGWPEHLLISRVPARVSLLGGGIGLVAARPLPDGRSILVGRDARSIELLRRRLFNAVWEAMIVIGVIGVALTTITNRLVLRRVEMLSETARLVSSGQLRARATLAQEVSPFGDIARALNAMLDEVERLILGLRTVTDSLAHDLRTPLARVRRALEAGIVTADPAARLLALEMGRTEIDRTIGIFNALIDIARAEGGLSRSAMSVVDVAELLRAVFELFEPLAEEQQLQVHCDISEGATLYGHRPLLMQAASNLVHNALKYTPRGGTVRIALRINAHCAEIIVADSGPGIPAERRDAAIQRFTRLSQSAGPDGSAGLGLAIVDACARLHEGALLLEDNAPGLRARLQISLRLRAFSLEPAPAAAVFH